MPRSRLLAGAALAAVILVAVIAATSLLGLLTGRAGPGSDPLIIELDRLRAAVDSCRASLAREEARFMEYDSRVDSLRSAVRARESADRTVPADQYEAYLELFDEYNAAVPVWHARADSLRASWGACRDLTETHNVLADSAAALWPGPGSDEAR